MHWLIALAVIICAGCYIALVSVIATVFVNKASSLHVRDIHLPHRGDHASRNRRV